MTFVIKTYKQLLKQQKSITEKQQLNWSDVKWKKSNVT